MAAVAKGVVRVDVVSDTVWYVLAVPRGYILKLIQSLRMTSPPGELCWPSKHRTCTRIFVCVSLTVCLRVCSPWCFIGKRRLETAIRKFQVAAPNCSARALVKAQQGIT